MKIIKTTLLFLILSGSVFAKDSTTVDFKRFSIGIHVSPDYCFRNLTLLTATDFTTNKFNIRNQNEIPMIGYTAGADLSFCFKKNFSISLGADFSEKGYISKDATPIQQSHPEWQVVKVISRNNYNYVEINVQAHYFLGKKNIRLIASAGVKPSFLLFERTVNNYEFISGSKAQLRDLPNYIYTPFNLFLTGSIGADLLLGKKMELTIEPAYCYGLRQTISAAITEHLWNAGLNIGWHIRF